MSDLEQRVADALAQGARGAPSAAGLADAARSRARRRRRSRLVGVAAVVALGIGVPTAVVATGGSEPKAHPGPPVAKDPAVAGQELPGGYHYESWHDVTVEVPDTWGYGALGDWCANDGTLDTPRVERFGTVHLNILCTPSSSYGVSFAPAEKGGTVDWPVAEQHSEAWPDGAFVGAATAGDVVVTVAAQDMTVALDVLASAQRNESLDPNGCPVTVDDDPVVPADDMAVCRYDTSGLLEQSELLTGDEVASAEHALDAAPPDQRRGPFCAEPSEPLKTVIKMASLTTYVSVTFGDCWFDDRVISGDQVPRMLTKAVLYWALSPGWSGSVPGGVSLPSELRSP